MKIYISGGSGNIGKHLIPLLIEKGHYVINDSLKDLTHSEKYKNYTYYDYDISDSEKVGEVFKLERPDIVIHLAGILSDNCEKDRDLAYRVNVLATKILADLSLKYSVKRFIFSSTCAVYEQNELVPTKEDENINPISYYGKTKLEAENYLLNLAGLPVVVLRIFNVYGDSFDSSLVNKLLKSSAESVVPIIKPDKYYRDYIHYIDVINVIAKAVSAEIKKEKIIINVASGKATSNSDLIKELSKNRKLFFKEVKTDDNLDLYWADISNLKRYIPFNPSRITYF